jgi:hypothetical protein
MKPIPFALLLLSFQVAALSAQEPIALPDKPGTWIYAYLDDENTKMYARQFGMTPNELID